MHTGKIFIITGPLKLDNIAVANNLINNGESKLLKIEYKISGGTGTGTATTNSDLINIFSTQRYQFEQAQIAFLQTKLQTGANYLIEGDYKFCKALLNEAKLKDHLVIINLQPRFLSLLKERMMQTEHMLEPQAEEYIVHMMNDIENLAELAQVEYFDFILSTDSACYDAVDALINNKILAQAGYRYESYQSELSHWLLTKMTTWITNCFCIPDSELFENSAENRQNNDIPAIKVHLEMQESANTAIIASNTLAMPKQQVKTNMTGLFLS